MSIALIIGSVKTINGLLSTPNAAQLQLPNTFQREDYASNRLREGIAGIIDVMFQFDISADFSVGDSIYYEVPSSPEYDGIYIVQAIADAGGGEWFLRLPGVFTTAATVGFVNNLTARPNYEVNIQVLDPATLTPLFDIILRYTPRPDGSLFVDLGGVLVEYMEAIGINSQEYIFKYWESWTDGPAPVELFSDTPQAILGRKQQFQEGGANMWEYLLNLDPVGQLLTRFKNPLMWRGWARAVSILYDVNVSVREPSNLFRTQFREANINKVLGILLANPQVSGTPPRIETVDMPQGEDAFLSVRISDGLDTVTLSERLFYRILDQCKNPIAIQWLNSLGAPEMHLFSGRQNINDLASEGTQYQSPVSWDLSEENRRTKGRTQIDTRQQILLTASGLTLDQLEALTEIKASDFVWLFLNKSGSELLPVVVVTDFVTEHETDGGNFEFSVLVELPDGVNFNTVKQY